MDFDFVYDKAQMATSNAVNILSIQVSVMDREDITQEAAIKFWQTWQKSDNLSDDSRIAYAYVAARNAAIKFIDRKLFGNNPIAVAPFIDDIMRPSKTHCHSNLPDDVLTALFKIFLESRQKRGKRSILAACREVYIVNGLYRGDSPAGIANDLNISTHSVKKYRRHIMKCLRAYAQQQEEKNDSKKHD